MVLRTNIKLGILLQQSEIMSRRQKYEPGR
jgi:hypothetical protein